MDRDPLEQRELIVTRRLKAPRALVWRTFEDPYLLTQWWGPENFTSTVTRLDFRAGGEWHITMHRPDGGEHPVRYQFVEITPPERIVYRNREVTEHEWAGDPPPSFKRTITLTEANGVTTLTLFAEFENLDRRDSVRKRGFVAGTLESYDRLEQHLEALA